MTGTYGSSALRFGPDELEAEFELLEEIGRGATAIVYRARDRAIGREVALKVVRTSHVDEAETLARLEREAKMVGQLHHPNIVTLYAVRRLRDNRLVLVMRLVPGQTLRQQLRAGPIPVERAEGIIRDLADALAHAHERGVVHRDVKPENIFLEEETGRALLADFGVARSLDQDAGLTATGATIGTPTYMAPEQIDGKGVDGRADLYSLGLVGWEMLSGSKPWDGENLFGVLYKQKCEDLLPLDAVRADIPDRLQFVIERLLKKNPDERWPTARAFVEDLPDAVPAEGWWRWHAMRRVRGRARAAIEARSKLDARAAANGADTPTEQHVIVPEEVREARQQLVALTPDAEVTEPSRRRRGAMVAAAALVLLIAAGGVAALVASRRERPDNEATSPAMTLGDRQSIEVPFAPLPRRAGDSSASAQAAPRPTPTPPPQRATPPATVAPQPVTPPRSEPRPADQVAKRDSGATSTASLPAAPRVATPTPTPTPTEPVRDSGARVSTAPAPAPPARATIAVSTEPIVLSAGGRHSCAVLPNGGAMCWGANDQGQLGDGALEDRADPRLVLSGAPRLVQIVTGVGHSCALTAAGEAFCWGTNDRGQLGDGTTMRRSEPIRVVTGSRLRTVSAGLSHSCGLATSGEVLCWGTNAYGQLGAGAISGSPSPVAVGSPLRFLFVTTGWNHTCAIDTEGAAWCWGRNTSGQLGDGSTSDRKTPTRVTGAGDQRFVAIAAGSTHSCAIAIDGGVYCWGKNSAGQLGTGDAADHATPVRVASDGEFTGVAAGTAHSCARTREGRVFCWGRNGYGQIGDGSTADRLRPTAVALSAPATSLQSGGAHTCATTTSDERYCWGYNAEGQLGDGTRDNRARPTRVVIGTR